MDVFLDEVNKCAISRNQLRRGDYSFKLNMNPWQHPDFDENKHHFLSLLASLCNGCGGAIYLLLNDEQTVAKETFKQFEERLNALIHKAFGVSPLLNLRQVSLPFSDQRIWALLQAERYPQTLQYHVPDTEGNWRATTFKCDISGRVHSTPTTGSCGHITTVADEPIVVTGLSRESNTQIHRSEDTQYQRNRYTPSPVPQHGDIETLSTDSDGHASSLDEPSPPYTSSSVEDFSSYRCLHWSENKKD